MTLESPTHQPDPAALAPTSATATLDLLWLSLVVHDFGGPLTALRSATQRLHHARDEQTRAAALMHLDATVQWIIRRYRSLDALIAHHAGLQPGTRPDATIDLRTVVQAHAECLQALATARADALAQPVKPLLKIMHAAPTPLLVRCAGTVLERVLENLVLNSVEAQATRIWMRAFRQEHQAVLVVLDNGRGVQPSILNGTLIPGRTTKLSGHGLGLAGSAALLADVDGTLVLSNVETGGAVVRVTLPLAD